MKWIVVLILLLLTRTPLGAQGQVVFNNRVNNVVQAPVYGLEPLQPSLAKHGNTPTGFPAGSQTYDGLPLAGSGFTAQLFGASTRAPLAILQPLTPTAGFRSGDAAGFVVPPNFGVSVPAVTEGETARIQLRVWDNRGETVTNWAQVVADPTIAHGESLSVVTPPLGSLFRPPPNLIGLESFNLVTGAVQTLQPLRINFQPVLAPALQDYLVDDGSLFGPRAGGFDYGWSEDMQTSARQRNSSHSLDQRHDTFIEMSNSTWELAVPDGVYGVHVAAGDPQTLAGVYRLEVEGVPVLQGTPAFDQYWVEGQTLIGVNDGRLTLRGGDGSFSNRVCFIELVRVEPPRLRADELTSGGPFRITFQGDPGVSYDIESSGDLVNWFTHGRAQDQGLGEFVANDATLAGQRFFRAHIVVSTPPSAIFTCDFESNVPEQWSSRNLAVAPSGRKFLGLFGATNVTLVLTNLPAHSRLIVSFDLLVTGSWEGNESAGGPDRWEFGLMGVPAILKTTFRTVADGTQAYPGNAPTSSFPPYTGAAERNSLGFGNDAVYRLSYGIEHSADSITVEFRGGTTEPFLNEGWGLDNVQVMVQD